jgi:hypothetical protein
MAASQSQPVGAADFAVCVFVNHDPIMASVFLSDLFSNFLDSAWQLPAVETAFPGYYTDRDELGRHVFAQSVPGSTTLDELAGMIEQQFGIGRDLHARFTVFHDRYNWHDKPLPQSITLREVVQPPDEDEMGLPPATGLPKLHLVLETKAAALNRVIGSRFLSDVLGTRDRYYYGTFNHYYHANDSEYPDLARALLKWRHIIHVLSYLYAEQRRGRSVEEAKIKQFEKDKAETKTTITRFVRQWASWVVKPDDAATVPGLVGDMDDDAVEAAVQWVWDTKHKLVNEWKISERKQSTQPQIREPSTKPTPDEPPQECPIKTKPVRNPDNTLSRTHSSFTVTSGLLLWGHVLPMHHGSQQAILTNDATSIPPLLPGGTIMKRVYTYRSAARLGEWKIRRYHSNFRAMAGARDIPPTDHAGWVYCHEDIDPMDVIRRVRAITRWGSGISNGNGHIDKGVVYIGRYDWSWDWRHPTDRDFVDKFQAWAEPAVGRVVPMDEWDDKRCNVNERAYFMTVDAEEWGLDLLRAYKRECEDDGEKMVERVFENGEGERFGAYVRMPYTEYEYGKSLLAVSFALLVRC